MILTDDKNKQIRYFDNMYVSKIVKSNILSAYTEMELLKPYQLTIILNFKLHPTDSAKTLPNELFINHLKKNKFSTSNLRQFIKQYDNENFKFNSNSDVISYTYEHSLNECRSNKKTHIGMYLSMTHIGNIDNITKSFIETYDTILTPIVNTDYFKDEYFTIAIK